MLCTKNCVRCLKKASLYTGHVLEGKKMITAGWCSMRCLNILGFSGIYTKQMGKFDDKDEN